MRAFIPVAMLALAASPCAAADVELEFTEQALNHLLGQLGDPGRGGTYQPNILGALGYSACQEVGTIECPQAPNPSPTQQSKAYVPVAAAPAGATQVATRPVVANRIVAEPLIRLASCRGPTGGLSIVPAADPVSWQWWITEAHFTILPQQFSFTATVRYQIGGQWFSQQQTVPAELTFDSTGAQLRIDVSTFKVPIRYSADGQSQTITEVDVAQLMSFKLPITPFPFQAPALDAGSKSVVGRAQSGSVQYLAGLIQVKFDAVFN
jgi:hypothetical protein